MRVGWELGKRAAIGSHMLPTSPERWGGRSSSTAVAREHGNIYRIRGRISSVHVQVPNEGEKPKTMVPFGRTSDGAARLVRSRHIPRVPLQHNHWAASFRI